MNTINVFVYGTLRPGQYNDQRHGLSDVAAKTVLAQANGRMYHVSHDARPIFPVVNFNEAGIVIGDLLIDVPADSEQFYSIDRMEKGAGYESRIVQVLTADGEMVEAITYHYSRRAGFLISHGDWLRFYASDGADRG